MKWILSVAASVQTGALCRSVLRGPSRAAAAPRG